MGGRDFTSTIFYRASTEGDNPKIIRQKCYRKKFTVSLCRSENGVCFGGFVSQ